MKKTLVALGVGLAVAVSANVAVAYVAVVGTGVQVTTGVSEDKEQLDAVLRSAIEDVLNHAIGFKPSVVTLEKAIVVGDRLYILLFVTDEDDPSAIEALSKDLDPKRERDDTDGRPPAASNSPSQIVPEPGSTL